MSGVHNRAINRPRVYSRALNSVEDWLTDRVVIVRLVAAGTNDGTPITTEMRYGPFLAKLYARSSNDQRMPDRHDLLDRWQITVKSDVMPLESDVLDVSHDDEKWERWRINGTVNQRPAAWGQYPVWQIEVMKDSEF